MSRVSMFSSPLLLGFEDFERTLDRISKMQPEGYPPYNIEQIGENRLRITLAVAGFSENDLSIQLEDNQLVIHVELARPEPEVRVRKIEISTAKPDGAHDGTLEIDQAAARGGDL